MQQHHPLTYLQPPSSWCEAARRWAHQRLHETHLWLSACVTAGAHTRSAPAWTIWGLAGALRCGVAGILLAAIALCLWVVGAALAHGIAVVALLRPVPETLLALAVAVVGCALILTTAFLVIAAALDGVWRSTARRVATS
jgi:hypothetical protein